MHVLQVEKGRLGRVSSRHPRGTGETVDQRCSRRGCAELLMERCHLSLFAIRQADAACQSASGAPDVTDPSMQTPRFRLRVDTQRSLPLEAELDSQRHHMSVLEHKMPSRLDCCMQRTNLTDKR